MSTETKLSGPISISAPYGRFKHLGYDVRLWEGVTFQEAEKHREITFAAVEMYEALKDILTKLEYRDFYKTSPLLKAAMPKIKAALAKACPNNESKAEPCECGSMEYFLSPIVGARCSNCKKPLKLKAEGK